MPGIALRSWPAMRKGMIFGAAADLFVSLACVGMVWEPRRGYNEILAFFLPPMRRVITHTGGGQASAFFPGLLLWWAVFHLLWALLWSPRPSAARTLGIVAAGQGTVLAAALFLWFVSPMDHWWSFAYKPHRIESPIPYFMVFVTTMPLCSLAVAWFLKQTPEPPHDPLKCVQCNYNLTGNVSGVCPECGMQIADWKLGDSRFAVPAVVTLTSTSPPPPSTAHTPPQSPAVSPAHSPKS